MRCSDETPNFPKFGLLEHSLQHKPRSGWVAGASQRKYWILTRWTRALPLQYLSATYLPTINTKGNPTASGMAQHMPDFILNRVCLAGLWIRRKICWDLFSWLRTKWRCQSKRHTGLAMYSNHQRLAPWDLQRHLWELGESLGMSGEGHHPVQHYTTLRN